MVANETTGRVVVIDDDPLIRETVASALEPLGMGVVGHDGAASFLAAAPPERPACLLVDMRMPQMSGLALMRRLTDEAPPAVMITGFADVPLAVETFRSGAFDFLEKPFSINTLIETVERALTEDRRRMSAATVAAEADALLSRLSDRERGVLDLLVEGLTSKEVGRRLGISHRTVERHRERIFERTGVRNAVELAALLPRRGAGERSES